MIFSVVTFQLFLLFTTFTLQELSYIAHKQIARQLRTCEGHLR